MKIPKKVKVGGLTYKVLLNYKFKEREDLRGQCDNTSQEIRLAGNICQEGIEQTFMHELLHAIDNVYNAYKLDDDTVERISQGLYQTLNKYIK